MKFLQAPLRAGAAPPPQRSAGLRDRRCRLQRHAPARGLQRGPLRLRVRAGLKSTGPCRLVRPALRILTPWPPLHEVERGKRGFQRNRLDPATFRRRALPLHFVERDRG